MHGVEHLFFLKHIFSDFADWESNAEELASHTQSFRAILDSDDERLSSYLTAFIRNILGSVTPTDFSRCRLLKILFLAQNGDFSFLSRSAICNNDKDSAVANKAKSRSNKLTQNQYDCMMRKRKQKYDSEVVQLPMFPGNIKKLETKLGSNLVSYSKKERFIYEMKHQLNNRSFNNNVNMTYIEVWSKNKGAIKSIKSCLRQKAIEAQRLAEIQKEVCAIHNAQVSINRCSDVTVTFLSDDLMFALNVRYNVTESDV